MTAAVDLVVRDRSSGRERRPHGRAARIAGHPARRIVTVAAHDDVIDRDGQTLKGRIEVGADADLVVLTPDEEFVVYVGDLAHKNQVCAYAGRRLSGVVRRTWLRGTLVAPDTRPHGRFLERGRR